MADIQVEQLKRLPQNENEVFQGGLVRVPKWYRDEDGKLRRPWVALWLSTRGQTFSEPWMCQSGQKELATGLQALAAFAESETTQGYRPGVVEVSDQALADYLEPRLAEANIAVVHRSSLSVFDDAITELIEEMTGHPAIPSMLSEGAVTLDHVHRFAEAAAGFYRAAPWRHLSDNDVIRIDQPKPPAGFQYVTVLGAAYETFGLGIHHRQKDVWEMRQAHDDLNAWLAQLPHGLWHFTFGDIAQIPTADADLWEDHGLPVAGEAAYPCLMCYSGKSGIRRPTAKQLEFVAGLVQALAQSSEAQIDQGQWSVTVETGEGPVEYKLALPDLLNPPSRQTLMERGITPDRRSMEQVQAQMQRYFAEHPPESIEQANEIANRKFQGQPDPNTAPPRTALEQAQALCYQAFDAIGRRRVQLARQALDVSPDCADAYVLLAEHGADLQEACRLYREGVAAGERALGQQRFTDDAGHFWDMIDTRPYMRARFGLAQTLEDLGQSDEAADHYRALLELNPGDNQGVRYRYLPCLLKADRDAEAARYMKQVEDEPTANWRYTKALLAYRLGGDTATARKERDAAVKANAYVPEFLNEGLPEGPMPRGYSPGSREEAMICIAELTPVLEATPGAEDWLKSAEPAKRSTGSHAGRAKYKQRKRKSR